MPVVFQYFYWPKASKITACLQVSANLPTFRAQSVLYRGEIIIHNTFSEAFTNQLKMSLLTGTAYWDTNAAKPFLKIFALFFCLLSRTVFEILHYLQVASWLFIITG